MKINEIPHEKESVAITGIKPGEFYVAQRNGPAQLLTAHHVSEKNFVCPKELAYPYDTWECYRVTEKIFWEYWERAEEDFRKWKCLID